MKSLKDVTVLRSAVCGYNDNKFWRLKRKCQITKNYFIKMFYLSLYNRESLKYGAYIGYNAIFEDIPTLPHGLFGVFVTDQARIGWGCVIFHHVTIGSNTLRDSRGYGAPQIGDNCYIGAGAKIIGNVQIGDFVRIGANCIVTKDIPSHSTVVMPSPRILERENEDNEFVRVKNPAT